MNTGIKFTRAMRWLTAGAATVLALAGTGMAAADDDDNHMSLRSSTFENGGTLPNSMIFNNPARLGLTQCTPDGSVGGNESPQLTWRHAPDDTRSFAVIMYDFTAQFTHWMMYNIPAGTTSLEQNASALITSVNNRFVQNGNDFFDPGYDGPCPPPGLVHRYIITVYALDTFLPVVPTFGVFTPAGPEGLYREIIEASRKGHVLASATLTGNFASTPPN